MRIQSRMRSRRRGRLAGCGGAEELLREDLGSLLLPLNQEAAGDLRRSLHRHARRERRGRRHGGGHPVRVRAARDHDRGGEGADAEGARRVQNDSSTDKALTRTIRCPNMATLLSATSCSICPSIWLQSAPAFSSCPQPGLNLPRRPLIWLQSGFNLPRSPSECLQSGFNLPRHPSICPQSAWKSLDLSSISPDVL